MPCRDNPNGDRVITASTRAETTKTTRQVIFSVKGLLRSNPPRTGSAFSVIPLSPSESETHWNPRPQMICPMASVMMTKLTPLTRTAITPSAAEVPSMTTMASPTAAQGEKP
jgi:hypothetical protein